MEKCRLATAVFAVVVTTLGMAQDQAPNTWRFVGGSEGWPQERQGRMIFAAHTPPQDLTIGNRGRIVFFGRSNNAGGPVTPWRWTPPIYSETTFGTFSPTTEVGYELFCCGITLMMDGKIATAGSNFDTTGHPNSRTAVHDPVTNHWTATEEQGYWMSRVRYYPTLTRMPSGKIVVSGGQANELDPHTWSPAFWRIQPVMAISSSR